MVRTGVVSTIKSPTMQGLIRRRMLVNFRVDPDVMQSHLPKPFAPKINSGYAIAGICLIRLEQMLPRGLPLTAGFASENAAHRVAVHWTDAHGEQKEGVFIPRRDTDSLLNHVVGGRVFPGEHHLATFDVKQSDERIALQMQSRDHTVTVEVEGHKADRMPDSSVFATLEEASEFFRRGSVGYSACTGGTHFDGLLLETAEWRVRPLLVDHVFSSYFHNPDAFPAGSVEFDCALLMENAPHHWVPLDPMPTGGS